MARRFALVSFAILCLALSGVAAIHGTYNLSRAQTPGAALAGYTGGEPALGGLHFVILENGDVWANSAQGPEVAPNIKSFNTPAVYVGNFWTGDIGPVSTSPSTLGQIKAKYESTKKD